MSGRLRRLKKRAFRNAMDIVEKVIVNAGSTLPHPPPSKRCFARAIPKDCNYRIRKLKEKDLIAEWKLFRTYQKQLRSYVKLIAKEIFRKTKEAD